MSEHGWRLERSYLAGAGLSESRLEGLNITWSDALEPSGHSALWADNGTGKTMITALRYALYLPHSRDFIRGDSDRSLAKLVRSEDVCHVVEQATRIVNGELQRIVVGMVASWADGGTQDLDNPSKLNRTFYGWLSGPDGPTVDMLPFRTTVGRWSTHKQFVGAVRELLPHGGAAPPFAPSDHQRHWQEWLISAGVDLDQVRFQTVMNASEGGVDRVMRFADSDEFVRWLIGATMPTTTVDQITHSIDTLRANAAARPQWDDELTLWQRIIDPLLNLAIAHDRVAEDRARVTTAQADAAAVVADAEATISELARKQRSEEELHELHDQRRREAQTMLRRAQAHRLRMQVRAAELRVDEAEHAATAHREEHDDTVRVLAAWRLVEDVLAAREAASVIAGLEEQIAAAEKESTVLHREERVHRRAIARLLTHRRDTAASELATAQQALRDAKQALQDADADLESCLSDHATAVEQIRALRVQISDSEHTIGAAVAAGLLPQGSDPVQFDADLRHKRNDAHGQRERADAALKDIETGTRAHQKALHRAQRQASEARDDVNTTTRELRTIESRVDALATDDNMLDILAGTTSDLWAERTDITDRLTQRAEGADSDASDARAAIAAAQRIVDSIGEDGLLPPSVLAEDCARRCRAADVPAWPGWRWLADTLTPTEAEAFASARPDVASGVVVAHPDLVDRAVDAIGDLDLDVAVWVGAVIDPVAASRVDDHDDGTQAQVLLPPQGTFDRDAASRMLDEAAQALSEAEGKLRTAGRCGQGARQVLAGLQQLWNDFPEDPRNKLTEKIRRAEERRTEADAAEQRVANALALLEHDQEERQRDRDTAQQTIDTTNDVRLKLASAITAAVTLTTARAQLPGRRETATRLQERMDELRHDKPGLARDVADATEQVRTHQHARDDAAEALREAALSATTEGPVPADDRSVIEARLKSLQAAIAEAAIDPELHENLESARRRLSNADSKLDADTEVRTLAEELTETDGARHPVALATSIRDAERREGHARDEAAKADSAADAARRDYQQRSADTSDRSSPDVDGFPAAVRITAPAEADRNARQLDDLAGNLLDAQRREEDFAERAEKAAAEAKHAAELLEVSVKPLRHLADPNLTGRRADDTQILNRRIENVAERVRASEQALRNSEDEQRRMSDSVRNHANSQQARKVEDRKDPRVVDLILRLRGDEQLPAEAERIAGHLEQRAASLRDDLAHHDENVRTCATMLHVQAERAIQRLRSYQNQSRLPDGLGNWSDHQFVDISHEPVPADESVAVDRVARVVHAQLAPGAGRTDAKTMLFAAARALVDAPFNVRLLKPHIDLALQRVDVAELKNFSGGQRVTAGVLLYATMTRVRATGDNAKSIGWLWLDNPFGQASADQFVRTMRLAADRLGLQLVFTAAPEDKGALSMFDRVITLNRRLRPSSGEKVVVVDDAQRDLVDLELVQKDVMAVLGE